MLELRSKVTLLVFEVGHGDHSNVQIIDFLEIASLSGTGTVAKLPVLSPCLLGLSTIMY